jgi:hypothetical protein
MDLRDIIHQIDETQDIHGPKLSLNENKANLSEGLQYHIDNDLQLIENIYRPLSINYFALFREARQLYNEGKILVSTADRELLETQIGEFGEYNEIKVPLDYIITEVNREVVYENNAMVGDLDNYLSKYGFERVETSWDGGTWGDAFYIKTN